MKRLDLRLDDELYAQLEYQAAACSRSRHSMAVLILRERLSYLSPPDDVSPGQTAIPVGFRPDPKKK